MLIGYVRGGTNAGIRPPYHGHSTPWVCACGADNKRYWRTCKACNTKRK